MINADLNPHYDFNNEDNKRVVEHVSQYDQAFENADLEFLEKAERKALKGSDGYKVGIQVESPWGDNKVLEARIDQFGKQSDIVKKEIKVKPGFMLSLQRHRGREELWEVKNGILTVISDGKVHTVKAGDSIQLPKGNVHCMVNRDGAPVAVIETQSGTCREADNVRLIDFNNRHTVPLSNINEAQSTVLYAAIHNEIKEKFGCETEPHPALLEPNFSQKLAEMAKAA